MRDARHTAAHSTPEQIVAGASGLLEKVGTTDVPAFIRDRLDKLKLMISMLTDTEWRLPTQESTRVLSALTYFCEPEDLIPDDIPGLGFLDDAIMIELVVRELRHEIDAYRDFCEFRARQSPPPGSKGRSTEITREEWLAERRRELQSRMRRRRKRNGRKAGSGSPVGLL
jgi:uncharacterized membrane protein YkvA (DUF1232 family)